MRVDVSLRAARAGISDLPRDLAAWLGVLTEPNVCSLDWDVIDGRLALNIGLVRRRPLLTEVRVELRDGIHKLPEE